MKIIVDVMGCDHPEKLVRGTVDAAKLHPDYTMVLVGDSDLIKANLGGGASNIEIEHAPDVITNDDVPTQAIRQKTQSSLVRSFSILAGSDDAIGLVSGGSTGAVLTGATLIVKRLSGVKRPTLASFLPTVDGKLVCVADCGANVDSLPEYIAQFALMANVYVKAVRGIESPRIGLLSVGPEEKKGDERTRAAHALLKELPINFVGNLEARYAISGDYDVVVSDGFSGNILVKSTEGTAKMVMKLLKSALTSSLSSKIGALLMKKSLKSLKKKMDYHAYGGAPFLGVKKLVIKTHGSSNEVSTAASINNIILMHERNIISEIETGLAAFNGATEQQ